MCGLVGVIGEIGHKEKQIFKELMFVNSQRGMHGCGILKMTVSKDKKRNLYSIEKSEEPSCSYYRQIDVTGDVTALLGHSRHATVGKIEEKNNHPFEQGDYIGMHNGTIKGNFEGSKEFETDSQALYNLMNSKKDIKECLDQIKKESWSMAYCLAFLDKKNAVVNLIRNKERPLVVAKIGDTYFYASEARFLYWAFMTTDYDTKDTEFLKFEVDTLLSFDLNEDPDHKDFFKSEEDYVDSSRSYVYTNTNNYWNGGGYTTKRTVPPKKTDIDVKLLEDTRKEPEYEFDPWVSNREGVTISLGAKTFDIDAFVETSISRGCCVCGTIPFEHQDLMGMMFLPEFNGESCCSSECLEELTKMSGAMIGQIERPVINFPENYSIEIDKKGTN